MYEAFNRDLERYLRQKKLKSLRNDPPRYTLGEYSIKSALIAQRSEIASDKVKKVKLYVWFLSRFPQIRLVGLSGSVAMGSASKNDDIDVFIITAKRRLWTARIISIVLAKIFGIHRSYQAHHVGDKVCLNLFFDEGDISVPRYKRSEYVAHEVLQMKPLVSKDSVYMSYLYANRWVFDIFPNAKNALYLKKPNSLKKRLNFLLVGDLVEVIYLKFQLWLINKRRTTEIISKTQLWFFPHDFEDRLPKLT